ncbi:MAG: L-histidine N(alpha)-methyltransferase [Colwellia sp.]
MNISNELTAQKGIIDHIEKLKILSIFLGVPSTELKIGIALMKLIKLNTDSIQFRDNIKSYTIKEDGKTSSPLKGAKGKIYLRAVETALKNMGFQNDNLKYFFVNSSYEEFCLSIPNKCLNTQPGLRQLIQPIIDKKSIPPTYSIPTKKNVDIEEMFEKRDINQMIIYESEKAAKAWNAVLHNRNYKQYGHCEEALTKVFLNSLWKEFITKSEPDGFIKFGAGSASKDLLILKNYNELISKRYNITLSLVDYSQPMLDLSCDEILKGLGSLEPTISNYININLIKTDFLELRPINCLRRKNVPVAFFITGGTIGNLNEAEFFNSVKRVAETGDLLIVCAEMIPADVDKNYGAYEAYLLEKYDHQDAKDMIAPALEKIWYLFDDNKKNFREAITNSIKPRVIRGRQDNVSSISKSISVVFEAMNGKEPIKLITSTRYHEKRFVEFTEEFGFKLELVEQSHSNELFKSFVFRVN